MASETTSEPSCLGPATPLSFNLQLLPAVLAVDTIGVVSVQAAFKSRLDLRMVEDGPDQLSEKSQTDHHNPIRATRLAAMRRPKTMLRSSVMGVGGTAEWHRRNDARCLKCGHTLSEPASRQALTGRHSLTVLQFFLSFSHCYGFGRPWRDRHTL